MATNFLFYPNPTSGIITAHSSFYTEGKIELYDMNGRILFAKTSTFLEEQIDLQNLPQGTYVLVVQKNEKSERRIVLKN